MKVRVGAAERGRGVAAVALVGALGAVVPACADDGPSFSVGDCVRIDEGRIDSDLKKADCAQARGTFDTAERVYKVDEVVDGTNVGCRSLRGFFPVEFVHEPDGVTYCLSQADGVGAGTGDPAVETTTSPATVPARSVTVTGPALATFDNMATDGAVGEPSPVMTGEDLHGETLTIGEPGRATLVLVIAHWCTHCQAVLPSVVDWAGAGGLGSDVDLVTVVTASDPTRPNYPADVWLGEQGWAVPTLVDDDSRASAALGATSYPFWVGLDADGVVVLRASGELAPDSLDQVVTLLVGA